MVGAVESGSGGTGFDSRRARVTFGVDFWSCRGDFFMALGMCGEWSGDVLGCFSFFVGGGSNKNIENRDFQKCLGVFFPRRGHQNKRFGHTPGPKNRKIEILDFWYFGVGGMGGALFN